MITRALTNLEQHLYETLPKLPKIAVVQSTCVWIVEWLPQDDQRTGQLLHCWMENRRPGWSSYHRAESKFEVIQAIEQAAYRAQTANIVPVLHLEAHGGDDGLSGPSGSSGDEFLAWDELTQPLQRLNVATNCNLVLVVAACTGFAAVKALVRGPRAPVVALVGPDAPLGPSHLLAGAKEFYRRWAGKAQNLGDIVESASREMSPAAFIVEPFAVLAYESFVESMILSVRPSSRRDRTASIRQRMLVETTLSAQEIDARLSGSFPLLPSDLMQHIWNRLFMIDQCPRNQERFGLDFKAISRAIESFAGYALP